MSRRAAQRQLLGRILGTLVERIAGLDNLAVRDQQARPARQLVLDRIRELAVLAELRRDDGDLRAALRRLDLDAPTELDQHGRALRVPRLEDLDDTRQTVRDVRAGDAAGVERAHR